METEEKSKPGRKKVEDKKVPVTVYVTKSTIEANGGRSACRDKCIALLNEVNKMDNGR